MNAALKAVGTDPVIEVDRLSRSFGAKLALDRVNLKVNRGEVFGLVGANGAGKTTLLKHLLGLLRAESGAVRVFGLDPVKASVEVLGRIGFLSEDRDMPGWMRVDEMLRYLRGFYPAWDPGYAETLRRQFNLDPGARVRQLSRGELAKLGLIGALAHRPELLVLDEPSSGLDPVVRRELLEAVVRSVADEGRTVVFSSHLLDEIERVSDRVAMMAGGKVVLDGRLDGILESHRRLVIRFGVVLADRPVLEGAIRVEGGGREWQVWCDGERARVEACARRLGGVVVEEAAVTLDEIFVARVGQGELTAGVAEPRR